MSRTEHWHKIEAQLGVQVLRVSSLGAKPTVQLEATTGTVYHASANYTLFQVCKAKNGQYAPQYKMMLASLDPMELSLATDGVAGDRADDPLDLPCYQCGNQVLQERGVLVGGASKMSAQNTRAGMVAGKDF